MTSYLNMCRALGMQGSQLFESADLVNGKYTSSIVTNLKTLQEIHARYSKLSPSSGASASSTAGSASPRAANTSAPSTPRAASGSVSAGSPRVEATSSQTNTPSAGKQAATPRKSEPISLSIPSTPDNVVRARDTKPKPDDDRVAIVQHWLEEVVGKKNTEESLFAWLKSGVILSEVLNVVKPGICKQIYDGPIAFKQLENVQRYLKLVPLAAGPTVPIFSPADLADEKNFAPVVAHIQAMASLVQRDPKWTGPVLDSESAPASARVDAIHAALASPRPAESSKAPEEPEEIEPVVEKPQEKVEVAPEPTKEVEPEQPTVVEPTVVEVVVVAEVEPEPVKESAPEKEAEPEVPAVVIVAVAEEVPVEDEKSSEVASETVSEATEDREEKEISETAMSVVDIVVADLVLEPEEPSQEEKMDLGSSDDEESVPEKEAPKSEEPSTPAKDESDADVVAEAPAAAVEAEAPTAAAAASSEGPKLDKVAELKGRSGYIASNHLLVDLAPSGKPMNRVAAQDELLYRVREILEDLDGRKPKTKAFAGRIAVSAAEGSKLSHVDSKTWKEEIVSGKWDSVSSGHRGLVVISCITEDSIPDHVGYPTKDAHRYARDMIEDMLDLAGEDPDLTDLIHADESLFSRSTSKDTASLIYIALKSE